MEAMDNYLIIDPYSTGNSRSKESMFLTARVISVGGSIKHIKADDRVYFNKHVMIVVEIQSSDAEIHLIRELDVIAVM